LKGKVANRVAIGGTVRSYFKNYAELSVNGSSIKSADAVTQLAGMLEIYFGQTIQPYIGTDAGVYFTNHIVQGGSTGSGAYNVSEHKSYFGAAPKAGIQFNVGAVSPFVQGQYHILFGGGDVINIDDINSETHDKFWTLDFGILLQVGKVGGKK